MKISAVIITLNEAAIIAKTLSQLSFCDEIIIIDSGSIDNTLLICKSYNCIVYHRAFDGYGNQKNFGFEQAKNDWILNIDADEVLTDNLKNEIINLCNVDNVAAFKINRKTVFLEKEMHFSGLRNEYVLRLLHKKKCTWNNSLVHEKLIVQGNIESLKNAILHYTAKDEKMFILKNIKYAEKAAMQMFEQNKKAFYGEAYFRKYFKFIEIFIVKFGFLDGKYGWKWARIMSNYTFQKYSTLEELLRKAKS